MKSDADVSTCTIICPENCTYCNDDGNCTLCHTGYIISNIGECV